MCNCCLNNLPVTLQRLVKKKEEEKNAWHTESKRYNALVPNLNYDIAAYPHNVGLGKVNFCIIATLRLREIIKLAARFSTVWAWTYEFMDDAYCYIVHYLVVTRHTGSELYIFYTVYGLYTYRDRASSVRSSSHWACSLTSSNIAERIVYGEGPVTFAFDAVWSVPYARSAGCVLTWGETKHSGHCIHRTCLQIVNNQNCYNPKRKEYKN